MTGNIFERLNHDRESFKVSGTVKSILFKGRVPDPEKEGKTRLVRQLIFAGETMDVRGGEFVFQSNGDFIWTFAEATAAKPKNLDAFIEQDPVFGTDAYVEVLFCLLYTSPSPRDQRGSRMPSSA